MCAGMSCIAGSDIGAAFVLASSIVRAIVLTPLALFLPGFVFMRATLPKSPVGMEYVTAAIGMSFVLLILSGLGLHAVGFLNPVGWCALLALVASIALFQSSSLLSPRRVIDALGALTKAKGAIVAGFGVAAIVMTAFGLSTYAAAAHRQFTYTDAWIVWPGDREGQSVTVGIRNKEQRRSTYDLELLVNQKLIARWQSFTLADDGELTKEVPLAFGVLPGARIEARLYNHDDPGRIYRDVWVTEPGGA